MGGGLVHDSSGGDSLEVELFHYRCSRWMDPKEIVT